ncbi:MAG: hypothetical protein Q9181_000996 [Wetmoreana brouardii]
MAPVQKPGEKRRWTLQRKKIRTPESSGSDYGQEILPTIDKEALKTLPRADRAGFKNMRKEQKKTTIARWRKEGKQIPETTSTSTESTASVLRGSPPPQLPELDMDVTRDTLGTAFVDSKPLDANALAYGGEGHSSTDQNKIWSEQGLAHAVTTPSGSANNQAPSQATPDTDETSLWLSVMEETASHTRDRRRGRGPFHEAGYTTPSEEQIPNLQARQTAMEPRQNEGITGESSAGPSMESQRPRLVEEKSRMKLLEDKEYLRKLPDDKAREYARLHGIGPVPPGLALHSNPPDLQDRIDARTLTEQHRHARETGQLSDSAAAAIERNVTAYETAARHTPGTSNQLFNDPGHRSNLQQSFPVGASNENASPYGGQPPRSTASGSPYKGAAREGSEGGEGDWTGELEERMGNIHISPMKRVTRKLGASKTWIKDVFKNKTEKQAKSQVPPPPASRARHHDEARFGTAKRVSMTPVKAPHPTQVSNTGRTQQPQQQIYTGGGELTPVGRGGAAGQRTTRAAMEGYD